MKRIIPTMAVDNCKEALEYYKEIFGGEIINVQLADGKEMFKGFEGKIIHAELHINDNCIIYINDIMTGKNEGSNITLLLEIDNMEEINAIYSTFSKQGNVIFELQKTFWGSYHAVVTDVYGITWSLDYSG
ncbi:MAG: VOC family protein [Syntrophomonas sp.]